MFTIPINNVDDTNGWLNWIASAHLRYLSLRTPNPKPAEFYKAKLADIHDLSHVTVEVQAA